MPVQPDPTHPKFLEGDDVLKPPTVTDDDVQGHVAAAGPDDGTEPEDLAAAVPEEDEDDGKDGPYASTDLTPPT